MWSFSRGVKVLGVFCLAAALVTPPSSGALIEHASRREGTRVVPSKVSEPLVARAGGQTSTTSLPLLSVETPTATDWHWTQAPAVAITPMLASAPIVAGSCTYSQVNDDPHISSTLPRATSVHGWWMRQAGSCPATATVTVELQAYGCYSGVICGWVTVATGQDIIMQGGGSVARVTARFTCVSTTSLVGWRGRVDVNLTGVIDPAGWTNSNIRDWTCSP